MDEVKKNTHGGARKGAGRKKVGDAVLYAKLTENSLAKLKSLAKAKGVSVSAYIEQLISEL